MASNKLQELSMQGLMVTSMVSQGARVSPLSTS